jgi:heptosyltransferase-2
MGAGRSSARLPVKILIRATNWIGDAVMSLPALRQVRRRFPDAHITVLGRPWVLDLYSRESFPNETVPFTGSSFSQKYTLAVSLRRMRFDCAILFQNAFEAAALTFAAGIPQRIGYARDGRSPLLTCAVRVPRPGEIPRHESYYYLELLRRAGLMDAPLPAEPEIRLEGAEQASANGTRLLAAAGLEPPAIGISPGAAYGGAKRWLPDRFAEAAVSIARASGHPVALFGSAAERDLCGFVASQVAAHNVPAVNFAGETTLARFIDMAAACAVFLTNDSGAMHVASALGVPTVAVFGATDHAATGPTGAHSRVVRHPVECSPCLLRECPIDHRCMTRVGAAEVAQTALHLLK